MNAKCFEFIVPMDRLTIERKSEFRQMNVWMSAYKLKIRQNSKNFDILTKPDLKFKVFKMGISRKIKQF